MGLAVRDCYDGRKRYVGFATERLRPNFGARSAIVISLAQLRLEKGLYLIPFALVEALRLINTSRLEFRLCVSEHLSIYCLPFFEAFSCITSLF